MICYIGVGSNLGDRVKNIKDAIKYLSETEGVKIARHSSVYETKPWGVVDKQDVYFNLVLELTAELEPRDLLFRLKAIEKKVGRKAKQGRWSAREIDLDILFYEDLVLKEEKLEIPHPLAHERFFVLKPLSDLAPGLKHPLLNLDVSQMLASLGYNGPYKKVEPFPNLMEGSLLS